MKNVALFRQKVYEKFNKVSRNGRVIRSRTVVGVLQMKTMVQLNNNTFHLVWFTRSSKVGAMVQKTTRD